MSNVNQTVVDFGVSGYVNTEVELKESDNGVKYVSVLLGRGKDARQNNLPSDSVVLYGKDAELFAMQVAKGDLIRFTKVALNRQVTEGKSYAQTSKIVGKDFVKIGGDLTDSQKRTIVDFGVSGYVNTEVELKEAANGTKYVSVLLGRGKDARQNNLPSDSVVLYGKDAELFAAQVQKGALIRFTKVALNRQVAEGKTYAQTSKLVGKDFEIIGRNAEGGQQAPRPQAARPQAQQLAPQQAAPQPDLDQFDDDIPF